MTRKLAADRLERMTVAELEAHLDDVRDEVPRPYLREVMAVRNAKVRQEHLDVWGLTEEEYAAAKEEAAKGETPLHVLLNRARAKAIKEVREARTARAAAASHGIKGSTAKGGS
jgi:ribosomal protein L7/L12